MSGQTAPMSKPAPVPPKKRPVWKSPIAIVAYVVVGVIVLLAAILSGDPEPEPIAAPVPAASSAPAPAESPAAAKPACQKVSKAFGQQILDGGNDAKLTYVDGAAVKADGGNYFVALRFTAEGGADQLVGVWQTLNLKTGPVRSVDGFAKEFTVWPDSGNAGAKVADDAKACLA